MYLRERGVLNDVEKETYYAAQDKKDAQHQEWLSERDRIKEAWKIWLVSHPEYTDQINLYELTITDSYGNYLSALPAVPDESAFLVDYDYEDYED